MIRVPALMVAAVLTLGSAAAQQAPGPVRDTSAQVSGQAVIRGRVVTATGTGLAGAAVVLTSGTTRPVVVVTNETGRYEFSSVSSGRYTLTAAKPGYLQLAYGQTRPAQDGKPLIVGEKDVLDNLNIMLPRGGVIAGVVVDSHGEPVIGAGVSALRVTYREGRRVVESVSNGNNTLLTGPTLTNDLGEFRIYGLEPGTFFVSATTFTPKPSIYGGMGSSSDPTVYAPGTPRLAEAQRVTVALAQTISGIGITWTPTKRATVSGTAFSLEGQPMTGARVRLRARGEVAIADAPALTTAISADGSFRIPGVPPGDYDVYASGSVAGQPEQAAAGRVDVNGEDVSGVRLDPIRLATGSGRFVFSPPRANLPFRPNQMAINVEPVDQDGNDLTGPRTWEPTADGGFSFRTPPGRMWLSPWRWPEGWILKAVRLRGVDVTDTGVDFRPGDEVRDLELELTDRPTELSGSVSDATGKAIDDYTVLIFAKDPARRRGTSRDFALARPDQTGRFSVKGLGAGEYLVIALEYVDVNEAQNPELLERLARDAETVRVGDAVQGVSLRLSR